MQSCRFPTESCSYQGRQTARTAFPNQKREIMHTQARDATRCFLALHRRATAQETPRPLPRGATRMCSCSCSRCSILSTSQTLNLPLAVEALCKRIREPRCLLAYPWHGSHSLLLCVGLCNDDAICCHEPRSTKSLQPGRVTRSQLA